MELNERQKRIKELAVRSRDRGIFTFTDFLSPSVLSDVAALCEGVEYTLDGGAEWAERKMVRFGSEDEIGYFVPFPFSLLKISPLQKKFAAPLSHRDFLGALLNLGIERDKVGDIFTDGTEGYIAIEDDLVSFVKEQLDRVGRTSVRVDLANEIPDTFAPKSEEVVLIVSSLRIDCVICKAYNLSRDDGIQLFRDGRVAVNGKRKESNADQVKERDTVTVRGFGRFEFTSVVGETQKGKLRIVIKKYK